MLTTEENALLTRVDAGAPMGRLLRRYWIPAALSEELAERDGDPVAVRLLGEELVAFRDTNGRIGLLDERCPHRLASMIIGRNEGCGITCVYHGWKFDVDGNCVDMPTEPEGYGFKDKIAMRSYPTHEAGGIVWAYLGPKELRPEPPRFKWALQPAHERGIVKVGIHANYLQAVEGSIDSAHSWFLHRGSSRDWAKRFELSEDTSPRLEAEDTPYGFRYAAIRKPAKNADTEQYVRVTIFVAPNMAYIPPPLNPDLPIHAQIFVPMDDETTMLYDVYFAQNGTPVDQERLRASLHATPGVHLDADWFRPGSRKDRWRQDRKAMKNGSWVGIEGFQHQDIAAQESMGTIVDRSQEHLGTSDVAVIRMRRRMLENVRGHEAGRDPIGLDPAIPYERIMSEQRIVPKSEPWQSVGAFGGEYAAR